MDITEVNGNAVPAGILDVFSVSIVMLAVIGAVFKLAWSRRGKIMLPLGMERDASPPPSPGATEQG
jgi:hypothetical protein